MKHLLFTFLGFGVLLFFFSHLNEQAGQTINRQARIIDSLDHDLSYYRNTYRYRVGTARGQSGYPESIHALSIDGGKNWILISESREVLQSRYLRNKYPNINPDSLTEVY